MTKSRKPKSKAKPKTKSKAKPKTKKPSRKEFSNQEIASMTITARLEQTLPLEPRIRVWPYADGSVDGEALFKVPRGTAARDLFIDIEEQFTTEPLNSRQPRSSLYQSGYWVAAGVRFVIKEDDEVYRRFRGYNDVNTHYQRATGTNIAEVLLIARDTILGGMEDKYGRKPDSIYIRLHWNAEDAKPAGREPHEE